MAPNIYVAVTMVQPHAGKDNDRPIRLYGVIPLKVTDPATKLTPGGHQRRGVEAASRRPRCTVSESSGRAMDYTLAIVDEGLLGLTSFRTPNLRDEFYQREALGVSTWDLFDEVAGAYGGELDRLLALGGSDAAKPTNPDEGKSRFPPVVQVPRAVLAQGRREARAHRGPAASTWARCASWWWPATAAPTARRRNPCSCARR